MGALLAFSDFGMSNGLVSPLARAIAADQKWLIQELISSALAVMVAIGLSIGLLLSILWPMVNWSAALGAHDSSSATQAAPALAIFLASVLVSLPLRLVEKVQLAYQEAATFNAWRLVGTTLTLAATTACYLLHGTLALFVAASVTGPIVASALNSVWIMHRRTDTRPRLSSIRNRSARSLSQSGTLFLVLAITGAIAYQTDILVLSHVMNATKVTTYGLVLKLFSFPTLLVSFALLALWPAFSDSLANDDIEWVRRSFRRAIRLAAYVNVPAAIILLASAKYILDAWVGSASEQPTWLLLYAFAIWTMLNSLNGPIAMLLNGANVVRFQVVCSVAMAIMNLGLSIWLTKSIGIAGPMLGTIISQTACYTIPAGIYITRRGWFHR